eukprot:scaffold229290_cov28-Tisochrysis_lutea.AAC.4
MASSSASTSTSPQVFVPPQAARSEAASVHGMLEGPAQFPVSVQISNIRIRADAALKLSAHPPPTIQSASRPISFGIS